MLRCSEYPKESTKYKQITKKLAVFIGSSNVATMLVENPEFRELLHEMDSRYVVPGRTAIRTKVLTEVNEKISQVMKKARKIHLCCDIWSMSESFIGITAHFFANHKRLKATLAIQEREY